MLLIGILCWLFILSFAGSIGLLIWSVCIKRPFSTNMTVQELVDDKVQKKQRSLAGWALVSLAVGFACYLFAFYLHNHQ